MDKRQINFRLYNTDAIALLQAILNSDRISNSSFAKAAIEEEMKERIQNGWLDSFNQIVEKFLESHDPYSELR